MADDIETRLRRLEDLQAIGQLFIDYGQYLDAGDLDAYVSLFAEDGEVRLGPLGKARGRDAIARVVTNPIRMRDGSGPRSAMATAAPGLIGDDTDDVLEEAGFTPEEIETLRREGVV